MNPRPQGFSLMIEGVAYESLANEGVKEQSSLATKYWTSFDRKQDL